MYQLPLEFQRFSTAVTLFVELACRSCFSRPRRLAILWRRRGAVALQMLIFLTGNYTFFNLLTMSLCVFLSDDRDAREVSASECERRNESYARDAVAVAIVILVLSVSELDGAFFANAPEPENALVRIAAPFQIANTYGLFASMTTDAARDYRPGIERRRHLARLRISAINPAICGKAPRFGRAVSAPARLADVVRGAVRLSRLALVRAISWCDCCRARRRCTGIARQAIRFPARRRNTCARSYSIIRSPIGKSFGKLATGGNAVRVECICARFRSTIFGWRPRSSLFDDQETGFDAIVRDPVPHHARVAHCDGVLELDLLPGVQRSISMHGAESALAVIQQPAVDFLRRGIVEGEFERAAGGVRRSDRRSAADITSSQQPGLRSAGLPHSLPSVKLQFAAQRPARDAQQLRRSLLMAVGLGKHPQDHGFLHAIQSEPPVIAVGAASWIDCFGCPRTRSTASISSS